MVNSQQGNHLRNVPGLPASQARLRGAPSPPRFPPRFPLSLTSSSSVLCSPLLLSQASLEAHCAPVPGMHTVGDTTLSSQSLLSPCHIQAISPPEFHAVSLTHLCTCLLCSCAKSFPRVTCLPPCPGKNSPTHKAQLTGHHLQAAFQVLLARSNLSLLWTLGPFSSPGRSYLGPGLAPLPDLAVENRPPRAGAVSGFCPPHSTGHTACAHWLVCCSISLPASRLHQPRASPELSAPATVTCSLEGTGEFGFFQRKFLSLWRNKGRRETHSGSFPSSGGWGGLPINKAANQPRDSPCCPAPRSMWRLLWQVEKPQDTALATRQRAWRTEGQETLPPRGVASAGTRSLCLLLGPRPSPSTSGRLLLLGAQGSVFGPELPSPWPGWLRAAAPFPQPSPASSDSAGWGQLGAALSGIADRTPSAGSWHQR